MRAVAEIASELGLKRPIPIITGVSAGAVNAAYLASRADDLLLATEQMAAMWSKITADRVFRTDAMSAGRSGLRFLTDATIGAFYRKKLSRSLLDTRPLHDFLHETIDFACIDAHLRARHLDALAVTAMNYNDATSVTFVQGIEGLPTWTRSRRMSLSAEVRREHVMASSAIPIFFPPIAVGQGHFGDGCLRNAAPLSPAIHLGADKVLVVSVRRPDKIGSSVAHPDAGTIVEPSLARILGVILNALLLDAIDLDVERMSRINSTLDFVPEQQRSSLSLRKVDFLWIRPSVDIGALAGDLFSRLPSVIRYLVGGLGSSREASELTSYLLFDPDFCGQLVRYGYEDGMANAIAIKKFLS